MTREDIILLRDAWMSQGGIILQRMLAEQASEPRETIFEILASRPDDLTDRNAIRLASRSRALCDFRDSIESEIKLLVPRNK